MVAESHRSISPSAATPKAAATMIPARAVTWPRSWFGTALSMIDRITSGGMRPSSDSTTTRARKAKTRLRYWWA